MIWEIPVLERVRSLACFDGLWLLCNTIQYAHIHTLIYTLVSSHLFQGWSACDMDLIEDNEILALLTYSYPLSTSRNQVLVQSQCYCQFLVGSTGEPFKNRLLFHWLESQYRARTYVTEYVSCFVSLARQRQTQQTCSRCIAPLRSIGTQHTKAPRERSKTIKSRQLSSRSRCLAPNGPRSADPSRTSLNKLSTMADVVLLLTFMALRIYNGIQTRRIQRVRV